MFIRPLQVFLQAAAEDELDVLQRFVAEQPIQFRTLKHIPGIFILYGDAVDGDNCAVVIFDFDTGGVDVVLTADSFHRTMIVFTLLLGEEYRAGITNDHITRRIIRNSFFRRKEEILVRTAKAYAGTLSREKSYLASPI